MDGSTLYLWSSQMMGSSDRVSSWDIKPRVVNLENLLPAQHPMEDGLTLIGSVEGSDIVFVTTNLGVYEVNLKSLQWKKEECFLCLIPYMSFYNPQGISLSFVMKQLFLTRKKITTLLK